MSYLSSAILVIIFYGVYFLHDIRCNSVQRTTNEGESRSNVGEFPRPNNSWVAIQERKMKYCGARLHEVVKFVCKSRFYSNHGKRSYVYGPAGGFTGESKITMECCKLGCSRTTLLKYCDPEPTVAAETLSSNLMNQFRNFFAQSRNLSPLGYQSNFVVPVQTARVPPFSENAEEIASNQEFFPQAVETTPKPSPRARLHVIPESNIVRDAEDDYYFSVGLY